MIFSFDFSFSNHPTTGYERVHLHQVSARKQFYRYSACAVVTCNSNDFVMLGSLRQKKFHVVNIAQQQKIQTNPNLPLNLIFI